MERRLVRKLWEKAPIKNLFSDFNRSKCLGKWTVGMSKNTLGDFLVASIQHGPAPRLVSSDTPPKDQTFRITVPLFLKSISFHQDNGIPTPRQSERGDWKTK